LKYLIFLVSYLSCLIVTGQDNKFLPKNGRVEIVKHQNYILGYSESHEQAAWVAYELTTTEAGGGYERTDNFRSDPNVSTGSAKLNDYKGSGYDRGHLAPAGDMGFSQTAMSESFYLSNMSPQVAGFNRGIWKKLESQFRTWANEKGSIYVITAGIFNGRTLGKIGYNGVTVPKSYYKIAYAPSEQTAIGFLLNNESSSNTLASFIVSVNEIETTTGLDFFTELDDSIEEEIESKVDQSKWLFSSGSSISNSSNSSSTLAQQCKGIASSTGVRCRNKTKNENQYCYHHQSQAGSTLVKPKTSTPSSSSRCAATTQAGSRCKRNSGSGSRYCWQHD
jgi:endonuclease G, mitochondrial